MTFFCPKSIFELKWTTLGNPMACFFPPLWLSLERQNNVSPLYFYAGMGRPDQRKREREKAAKTCKKLSSFGFGKRSTPSEAEDDGK